MSSRLPDPSADERAHSDRLLTRLREEIAAHGPMPFAQYMERCLYAPGLGYYSAGKTKFGEAGDFVTAPELGELFARCVVNVALPVLDAARRGCGLPGTGRRQWRVRRSRAQVAWPPRARCRAAI